MSTRKYNPSLGDWCGTGASAEQCSAEQEQEQGVWPRTSRGDLLFSWLLCVTVKETQPCVLTSGLAAGEGRRALAKPVKSSPPQPVLQRLPGH